MGDLKHTPCDCAEWRRLNEACADLLRERDALRKDAERYRWLRDNASGKGYLLNVWQGYELDGAIDAATQEIPNA